MVKAFFEKDISFRMSNSNNFGQVLIKLIVTKKLFILGIDVWITKIVLLRIQIRKSSYFWCCWANEVILFTIAVTLTWGKSSGRSFMYFKVNSSALRSWKVKDPNFIIAPIWKSVSVIYLCSSSFWIFFLSKNFPPQIPEFLSEFWYTWMVSSPQKKEMINFLSLSSLLSEIILASNLRIFWSFVNSFVISIFGGLGWREKTFPKLSSGEP